MRCQAQGFSLRREPVLLLLWLSVVASAAQQRSAVQTPPGSAALLFSAVQGASPPLGAALGTLASAASGPPPQLRRSSLPVAPPKLQPLAPAPQQLPSRDVLPSSPLGQVGAELAKDVREIRQLFNEPSLATPGPSSAPASAEAPRGSSDGLTQVRAQLANNVREIQQLFDSPSLAIPGSSAASSLSPSSAELLVQRGNDSQAPRGSPTTLPSSSAGASRGRNKDDLALAGMSAERISPLDVAAPAVMSPVVAGLKGVYKREKQEEALCKTSGRAGVGSGKRCKFPFTHDGVTYDGCTDADYEEARKWCSTATDNTGKHVLGSWGECSASCQVAATLTKGIADKTDKMRGTPAPSKKKDKDSDEEEDAGMDPIIIAAPVGIVSFLCLVFCCCRRGGSGIHLEEAIKPEGMDELHEVWVLSKDGAKS